ncbi:MAG: hypothetical protein Q7K57_02115 [Burkholderiaceae bacterium]|nr:hypothetical protein [Burkholderiaceae bacterium]
MKIERAFCIELMQTMTTAEAGNRYFSLPCSERRRWTFICSHPGCISLKPKPTIKAVGYDRRPIFLSHGEFACGEELRKMTPYFAIIPTNLNQHAADCQYAYGRTKVVTSQRNELDSRTENRVHKTKELKRLLFGKHPSQMNVGQLMDDHLADQAHIDVRIRRKAGGNPSPARGTNSLGVAVLETVIEEHWLPMTPAERAAHMFDEPLCSLDDIVRPVKKFKLTNGNIDNSLQVYYFRATIKKWPTGYKINAVASESPQGAANFGLWIPSECVKQLRQSSIMSLHASLETDSKTIICFFVGSIISEVTRYLDEKVGPIIRDWSHDVHLIASERLPQDK